MVAIGCAGAAVVPTAEAQVIAGLGLSLFAVYAAYFRPPRRFALILCVVVVGYLIATVANAVTSSQVVAVAILAVISGTSIMVSVQANRLRGLTLTEPLTGALNRRGMEQYSLVVRATANRTHAEVTVGVIDLNDFKGINDRLGHAAGDEMLIRVAEAWRVGLRSSDLLVRYGGDEFAVILVGTTPQQADELDARIRETDSVDAWSAGFTTWSADEDVYAAIARADEAMFRSKRNGVIQQDPSTT